MIKNPVDLENILNKATNVFIQNNLGCSKQCPFCGAICENNSPEHTDMNCHTRFHTVEAFRCNKVWKGAAYFLTCYE